LKKVLLFLVFVATAAFAHMKSISIPASLDGGTTPGVVNFNCSSPVLQFITADGPFQLQIGNEAAESIGPGTIVGVPNGPNLGRCTFLNYSASAAVNVQFTETQAPTSGVVQQKEAHSEIIITSTSVSTTVGFKATGTITVGGVTYRRKSISVLNTDGSISLKMFASQIRADGGSLGLRTFVSGSAEMTFETDATITFKSAGVGSCTAQFTEIFYQE
jgi:hypothetical protein